MAASKVILCASQNEASGDERGEVVDQCDMFQDGVVKQACFLFQILGASQPVLNVL